jgi:hypothetical protein
MLIKRNPNGIDLPFPSEITPQTVYEGRRAFLARAAATAVAGTSMWEMLNRDAFAQAAPAQKLAATRNAAFSTTETLTPLQGRDPLQQLLRVRHRQVRSGRERRHLAHPSLDRADRRRSQEAADARHRQA